MLSRRQALGLVMLALIVAGGSLVRRHLLLDGAGEWRGRLLLAESLPPPPPDVPDESPEPFTGPLDPNTCTEDSLTLLPGIGPALAARIAEARRGGMHFAGPQDLCGIKGIGPATARRIAPYLIFPDSL